MGWGPKVSLLARNSKAANKLLKVQEESGANDTTPQAAGGINNSSIAARGVNRFTLCGREIHIFRPKLHISAPLSLYVSWNLRSCVSSQSDCGSCRQRVPGQGVEQSARRLQTMAPATLKRQSKRWLWATKQKNTSSAFIRQWCR